MDSEEGCFVNIILGALGIWVVYKLFVAVLVEIGNFFGSLFYIIAELYMTYTLLIWVIVFSIVAMILFRDELRSLLDGSLEPRKKFVICPYCDMSNRFDVNWNCPHCGDPQGKRRNLDKPCVHCGRKREYFECGNPACDKEILL